MEPTRRFDVAECALHGLARYFNGDPVMSIAQSMRLAGTVNTKPGRDNALCHILEHHPKRRYAFADFAPFAKSVSRPPSVTSQLYGAYAHRTKEEQTERRNQTIYSIADALREQGFRQRGTWLNGPCPNAHLHKHGDHNPSFGFNTATGYGYCFVCGSMQLKELCAELSDVRLYATDIRRVRG